MVIDSTTAAAAEVESEIEPEGVVWGVADGALSTETEMSREVVGVVVDAESLESEDAMTAGVSVSFERLFWRASTGRSSRIKSLYGTE